MDKKQRLILMEIALIVILLIFSVVLEYRDTIFKRDCKVFYDINASCPCMQTKFSSSMFNLSNVKINNTNN
jgi:hypothetical protein